MRQKKNREREVDRMKQKEQIVKKGEGKVQVSRIRVSNLMAEIKEMWAKLDQRE